jgi:hypothetical protein
MKAPAAQVAGRQCGDLAIKRIGRFGRGQWLGHRFPAKPWRQVMNDLLDKRGMHHLPEKAPTRLPPMKRRCKFGDNT